MVKSTLQGILGLDMGLGKTVIAIAIMCDLQCGRTIIVLPLQLLEQWRASILRFSTLTAKEVVIYHGSKRHSVCLDSGVRVVLTTYDVVRMEMKVSGSVLFTGFDCVIFDEAHRLRNRNTKSYGACQWLTKACRHRWLLSGTVIHNSINDLHALAELLGVGDSLGTTSQTAMQQWKQRYYYRLTKAEANLQLPPKVVVEHHLEFDRAHIEVYVDLFAEMKEVYQDYLSDGTQMNFSNLLGKILRLRQCCNHPDAMLTDQLYQVDRNHHTGQPSAKFQKILELIQASPSDDKILIFSQWGHSLKVLAQYLTEHGCTHLSYNGQMTLDDKNRTLDRFKTANTEQSMLITLTSGGVGLDLSFANHVILLDSWWNPALEEQASDRPCIESDKPSQWRSIDCICRAPSRNG